jgi:hypothetical protein
MVDRLVAAKAESNNKNTSMKEMSKFDTNCAFSIRITLRVELEWLLSLSNTPVTKYWSSTVL